MDTAFELLSFVMLMSKLSLPLKRLTKSEFFVSSMVAISPKVIFGGTVDGTPGVETGADIGCDG